MAKIVLGMVSSHGPLLITPPEQWTGRIEADRRNPALFFRNRTYQFDALVEARAGENLEPELALDVRQQRFAACREMIEALMEATSSVRPRTARESQRPLPWRSPTIIRASVAPTPATPNWRCISSTG